MSLKLSYPLKFREVKERSGLFEIQCLQEKERLSCFKCKDILIEPYQSECGCRFCHSCINNKAKNCPSCNEVWKSSRYDKAIEREIFELNVKCVNKDCENKCKFKELKNHLEVCEYREEKCKDCDNGYLYKDQERHMGITCVSMKVICEDCGMKMSRREMEEKHRNVKGDVNLLCDNMKNVCPYGCSEEVKDSIKVHLNECPEKKIECVMKVVGCTEVLSRKNMDEHIRTGINHVSLLMTKILMLQNENIEIKSKYTNNEKKYYQEIEKLKESNTKMDTEVRLLSSKMQRCVQSYSNLEKEALLYKQSLVSKGISSFPLTNNRNVTYGEIIWKVENIVAKVRDAKSGINTMVFSDPFYSSSGGYKICLKVYPNGDGQGCGTHLSLYFVIMMGEYDDEISWPYRHKITLSILANDKSFKNHSMNMKPDVNELCYDKPKQKYNLAAGHPKFISHVELIGTGEFVKDDAIYVYAKIF